MAEVQPSWLNRSPDKGCPPSLLAANLRSGRTLTCAIPFRFLKLRLSIARNRLLPVWIAAMVSNIFAVEPVRVNVFAAASLADSLKRVTVQYEKHSADKLVFNLGASSMLARQIEEGAPADIFFSADEAKMNDLQAKGLIETATRRSRLSNTLVIIIPAKGGVAASSPGDLTNPKIKRVALGDPRAVPIGIYAKAYLQKLGLWGEIEPKVVPTENVRAALSAVEAGDADASIVYKTDAMISKKVKISYAVPAGEGPKISYPMALLKGTKEPEAAMRFLSYLESEEAGKVFEQYGFVLTSGSSAP